MCPAIVTSRVRARIGDLHRDDLLRVPVDEVRAVDVPADVEADERRVAAPLDRHDLAQQHGGVLHHEVARLERDGHAVRAEVAGDDGRIGLEIDRPLAVAGRPRRGRRRR